MAIVGGNWLYFDLKNPESTATRSSRKLDRDLIFLLRTMSTAVLEKPAAAAPTSPNESASPSQPKGALVLGAGVIGLTTAIRLVEAGYETCVLAQETPTSIFKRDTTPLKGTTPGAYTSSGSGGYWMPFFSDHPHMEEWCTATYRKLQRDALEEGSGVAMLEGFILRAKKFPEMLPWYALLTDMKRVTPKDDARVPEKYYGALRMRAPIANMDVYLLYLEDRLRVLGGSVEITQALSIPQACWEAHRRFGERTIVVNCTGISAHITSGDAAVRPGRGVTVRVKRPHDIAHFITEDVDDPLLSVDGKLAYCLPRGEEYTLGGTMYEDNWHTATEDAEAAEVIERCKTLIPGIEKAKVTGKWTGLRPLRDGGARVEVERGMGETAPGVAVVANYGHGGSGVTACWGTADAVVGIADEVLKVGVEEGADE